MKQTQTPPEFREYSACLKCGWNHLPPSPPATKYDTKQNLLVRTCLNCGYKWQEKPADDQPPPANHSQGGPPESIWKNLDT